ncbi:magnesium chelatase ATPase subunit I [Aliigemmobacter aestuarii]|uniref:Mg-protoporphyrin IX chelatase n=1 Tax=Aliigemmobacter aestuarii TaxID=1445661 RepID=A0A4S3MSX9_9RHOB|nr:magnesium chelatase ATPase subunit I [Gemmobacter aestuarii]THD85587.1 magnesium chelatase ATPase subunit I [Gemmobacter aestuarii]
MTILHRDQGLAPAQPATRSRPPFPFTAIVGQDDMRLAMVLTAIDPSIGGVLVFGDRGTGKSTAVRGLAALLPPIRAVRSCPVNSADASACPDWADIPDPSITEKPTPVVDLPLGVSEDRVTGALDVERAISQGVKAFEPGLLARANRGYLYIDEVNLLEDHIVDLLLDVAQSGENVVERDGLSIRHPARFVLVGSGNPEEGDLRPQLLDRFGLSVEVRSPRDIETRVEVVLRREAYEADPLAFAASWAEAEADLRATILRARAALARVQTPRGVLEDCAALCIRLGSDGVRGELTLLRAARALAASEGAEAVTRQHLCRVAGMSLGHRLRRDPLDEAGATDRVARAVSETLGCPEI